MNDYTSPVYTSALGIPQGSVISPILCNLYTSDNCVWENGEILSEEYEKMNKNLEIIWNWCRRWNMLIAPEKTEVMIFTPGNDHVNVEEGKEKYAGEKLKMTKSVSLLMII